MNRSETSSDETPEISADIDKETTNESVLDDNIAPASTNLEIATTNSQPAAKKITWNMVLREILFILALALTTYDAFQNSPPKISKIPTPVPLFGKGSLVSDWYKGQLSSALSRISSSEISFVMYYAPWDAETQFVSKEFEKAAHIMFKQVHFSAINCWQPGGECRLQHNKISVWPIIMVYTVHLQSVVYTGPKNTMSMVKFLRNVMKPIHRVTNTSELMSLVSVCEAVTVGFDSISNAKKSVNYNKFYNLALKSLEYDPFGDLCFAVVTSPTLAQELGVEYLPNLKLMMWNETLEYPADSGFTDDSILSWVWGNVHKKSGWFTPQWQKSFALQKLFASGPVLVLFTPRNLYRERNPNYDLFHEVALEYNDCDNPNIQSVVKYMTLKRRLYIANEFVVNQSCAEWRKQEDAIEILSPKLDRVPKIKLDNVGKPKWLNKTVQKSKMNEQTLLSFWLLDEGMLYSHAECDSMGSIGVSKCSMRCMEQDSCPSSDGGSIMNVDAVVKSSLSLDTVSKATFNYETSMLSQQNDPRSSVNLAIRKMTEQCILRELARDYHPEVYPVLMNGEIDNIRGLFCKTNKTLSFLAMDSLSNYHFAESLGVDILNIKDHTALVILDNERESQYLLNMAYGEKSLRDFIFNYTMDYLTRDLRTLIPSTKYTHYYGSDNLTRGMDSDFQRNINPVCNQINEKVCVFELTTYNFQEFVAQDKDVLVAMCSGGSGACGGLLSLALLAVNRMLGTAGLLSIGRVDSSKHDLPWQHTVPKYPSLIFFPKNRKADYFSYPENQPLTTEGLLAFVLSGMEAPQNLYAQVLLCNQTQALDSMSECLRRVRMDTVTIIGKTLKQIRRFNKTSIKRLLLKRLEYLRAVYVSLEALNTTKLTQDHPLVRLFKEAIDSLIRIWNTPTLRVYGPFNKKARRL